MGEGLFEELKNRDATLDTAHASSEAWGMFATPVTLDLKGGARQLVVETLKLGWQASET